MGQHAAYYTWCYIDKVPNSVVSLSFEVRWTKLHIFIKKTFLSIIWILFEFYYSKSRNLWVKVSQLIIRGRFFDTNKIFNFNILAHYRDFHKLSWRNGMHFLWHQPIYHFLFMKFWKTRHIWNIFIFINFKEFRLATFVFFFKKIHLEPTTEYICRFMEILLLH